MSGACFADVGNAVKINHIVVGILDMPLFVVTVVYGLIWRRTNWQGALAGFLVGGLGAAACYWRYPTNIDFARQIAPIVGTIVALIVTPIVTLLTPAPHPSADYASAMATIDALRGADSGLVMADGAWLITCRM